MSEFETDTPVHDWFGLTYSSYLVLPRSLMEAMPVDWQRQFVSLLNQMPRTDQPNTYLVRLRGQDGRFLDDPLAEYRRPDRELLDGLMLRARMAG